MNDYVDHPCSYMPLLIYLLSLAFKQEKMQLALSHALAGQALPSLRYLSKSEEPINLPQQQENSACSFLQDLSGDLDQQFNSNNYGIILQFHIK